MSQEYVHIVHVYTLDIAIDSMPMSLQWLAQVFL